MLTKKKFGKHKVCESTYDPITGLKLKTTDPLGSITTYYYDEERRPLFVIGPTGIVVQTTHNSFNEITESRVYFNLLSPDKVATLQGGFISDAIKALFVKDDSQDQLTAFEYNARGLLFRKTDPEKAVFEYTYNAFKECTCEVKPISATEKLTVLHDFDPRGNEIKTITTNSNDPKNPKEGDLAAIVHREFKNPYGKQTASLDECGNRTETSYDKRGHVRQTQDPVQLAKNKGHQFERDAFGRVRTETNSLGKKNFSLL